MKRTASGRAGRCSNHGRQRPATCLLKNVRVSAGFCAGFAPRNYLAGKGNFCSIFLARPALFHRRIPLFRMTTSRLVALAALSLVAMSNSCKKEDATWCPATPRPTSAIAQVAGLTARITEPVPNVGQTNQYFINSMAEYEAVFCRRLPAAHRLQPLHPAGRQNPARPPAAACWPSK